MDINRKYIKGYTKDTVKILEVTSLSLTEYIKQYLKEECDIYTFSSMEITGVFDNNIQVYKMQYTPLIAEEALAKAIESILDATILKHFNNTITQTQNTEDELAPNDWEDYLDFHKNIAGSFANITFQNPKIEKLDNYNEIVQLSDEFKNTFPRLTELLELARVTKITTEATEVFYLLGWSFEYGYFGGLTHEPSKENYTDFHEHHNLLATHFSGFIDDFGEIMDSNYLNTSFWQFSHKEILKAKSKDTYLQYDFYKDSCKESNVNPTLNLLENFVQFTENANGDFFMYDKNNSDVWMFNHEGFGNGIVEEEYGEDLKLTQIEGASESLFFKLENCSFVDWVENGAHAWFNCFEDLPFDINEL